MLCLSSVRSLTLCTCLAAGTLTAQEGPHKALVMGLNGPGLYFPISNSAALRAEGAISYSSSGGLDNWTESLALSGMFFQSTSDALKMYLGPRVGFTHYAPSGGAAHEETLSGSLFFGTEYSLSGRFSVFGEAGLTYFRTTGSRLGVGNNTIQLNPTNSASIFNGVGVLLHF